MSRLFEQVFFPVMVYSAQLTVWLSYSILVVINETLTKVSMNL